MFIRTEKRLEPRYLVKEKETSSQEMYPITTTKSIIKPHEANKKREK